MISRRRWGHRHQTTNRNASPVFQLLHHVRAAAFRCGIEVYGALLGPNVKPNMANDVHSSLNTPETHGAVDVAVNAGVVLPEARNGGLQKCDMIEGWSGSICSVADRSLRNPPLRHPRGGPHGSRRIAGVRQMLQTARRDDY
jgi:hypothetical protein